MIFVFSAATTLTQLQLPMSSIFVGECPRWLVENLSGVGTVCRVVEGIALSGYSRLGRSLINLN